MDGRSRERIRSWLMGAAAAGTLGPALLFAQADRAGTKPAARNAAPALLQPSTGPVRPIGYEAAGDQVAQSEVEQRLRELYERDGREMPPLNMATTPVIQPQASPPRPLPPAQPRYSAARPAAPAAKPQNKVTSFFKKLVPGGNKQAQAAPPRQLPPAGPQQPVMGPAQPEYAAGQAAAPPTVQLQAPVQYQPAPPIAVQPQQPAAVAIQPANQLPPSPAANSSTISFGKAEPQPVEDDADDEDDLILLPEPAAERAAAPQQLPAATTAAPAAAPALNEDVFDPFGEQTGEPTEPTEEQNPYTGMTLDEPDNAPAMLPIAPEHEPALEETTATKMRRIIQRTDMKGLKGFCPVTLRDQRELADSRPEHVAAYRGQKFFFASKVAQAKFEAEPARYAPAAYGADVVVLTDDQDVVEGTLDYAAWYKGRLYLFGSEQTHDTFVASPEKYASPPGIE